MPSLPACRPLLPRTAGLREAAEDVPRSGWGPMGSAPPPPSKTPPWPRPCPLSGPSQPEVGAAPVPKLVWGRGLSSPAGRRDE